jgi:hypothetical protein
MREIVFWEIAISVALYLLVYFLCWVGIVLSPSHRAMESKRLSAARSALVIWALCIATYFLGGVVTFLLLVAIVAAGAFWLRCTDSAFNGCQ